MTFSACSGATVESETTAQVFLSGKSRRASDPMEVSKPNFPHALFKGFVAEAMKIPRVPKPEVRA